MNKMTIPEMTPHDRFFLMLADYPLLFKFWDVEKKECDKEALIDSLSVLSHGESIMAKFFMTVWFGDNRKNYEFDIVEAASVLDLPQRRLITLWMLDPFWP
ncbi:hypothetical protein [Xenorhabdus sp. SGI246]|uniref:hypothetical protein n=1 Tax=Xenorhabdus sp. SGI246 TaxID=3158263 RepID=UPI00349FCD08